MKEKNFFNYFNNVTLIGSFSPVVKVMVSNRINKDSIKSVLEKTVDIQEGLVPQPLVPWHFEYSDPTQAVWYHDLGQSLMKETRALSLPQKTVITQDMLDKLKALGLQSLVEKMALEQGLPLHLIGDFPNYQVRSPNNLLTSEQISKYSEFYQRKVERMCVKYALNFKKIIVEEYGQNILSLSKIPLSSHFGFRLDKYIRKVTHLKRDRALGIGILDRVKTHITHKYNRLKKVEAIKQISFKKVISFLKFYREFSEYVSSKTGKGQFSISNIKYMEDTMELAPKSWLFENIRYMFPKRFGLPLRDDLLSWFLFGDTPSHGRVCKLKWTTEGKELLKRMHLTELLSIDYCVSKLSINDFKDKKIEITGNRLDKLQKGVSYIIYYYIFGGYHESTYVSPTTDKGINVGMEYFILEYELIRAAFFAAAEGNNGIPLDFDAIKNAVGVTDLKAHLRQGYGFGDDFFKLYDYVKDLLEQRLPNSDRQILKDSLDTFDAYGDKYEARQQELMKDLGYKSFFQRDVHLFVNDLFGIDFISEKQVRSAVGVREVTRINDDGVLETINVHGQFAFDTYLELNRALKDYLGLDQKWIGIAIEAMGTYYHSDAFPHQQEADRKKRLICKEMDVLLLEIWDNWNTDTWVAELLRQIKDFTGTKISIEKLNELSKYLGKR